MSQNEQDEATQQPPICPFMSRPIWNSRSQKGIFMAVLCHKEKCMSWYQSGEIGTCALIPGVTVENAPIEVDEAEDRRDS